MPNPDKPVPNGTPVSQNEGEGSRTAARRYNAALKKSMEEGDSDRLAEEAADALDGPEGEELREAERKGKAARRDTGG